MTRGGGGSGPGAERAAGPPAAPTGRMASTPDGLAAALALVGQRWALLLVRELLAGPRRYGDLQRELGVPTNILATRLRELQDAGVLSRVPMAHNVLAYELTERGRALRPVLEELEAWGAGE